MFKESKNWNSSFGSRPVILRLFLLVETEDGECQRSFWKLIFHSKKKKNPTTTKPTNRFSKKRWLISCLKAWQGPEFLQEPQFRSWVSGGCICSSGLHILTLTWWRALSATIIQFVNNKKNTALLFLASSLTAVALSRVIWRILLVGLPTADALTKIKRLPELSLGLPPKLSRVPRDFMLLHNRY